MDFFSLILRLGPKGLAAPAEFLFHGLCQLIRQDPQVRDVAPDPFRLRQLDDLLLARAAIGHLLRLVEHILADEFLTAVVLPYPAVRPRLLPAHLVLVEEPRHVDGAPALVGDHLGTPLRPLGRLGVDLDSLLDRVLVGDHEVAVGVLHLHEPIANAGWRDVVATAEGVVHAALHLGSQLGDERFVHRAENRQEKGGLWVGAVVAVAGAHDPDAGRFGEFPVLQRLDRVAAHAREFVDQEPRHPKLVSPLDD